MKTTEHDLQKPVIKKFPYTFTPEEKGRLAIDVNALVVKQGLLEAQKKEKVAELSAGISTVKAEIKEKSEKVSSGQEQRDYSCNVKLDFSSGKKMFYNTTDGLEMGSEPLTNEDYQLQIELDAQKFTEDSNNMSDATKKARSKKNTD